MKPGNSHGQISAWVAAAPLAQMGAMNVRLSFNIDPEPRKLAREIEAFVSDYGDGDLDRATVGLGNFSPPHRPVTGKP